MEYTVFLPYEYLDVFHLLKQKHLRRSLLKRLRQKLHLQRILKVKKKRMLLKLALQKIKPQLEMMLKQGQMVVLLLSQTSLVKQQLIPKVTLLSQQLWLELGLVQVLKQRTLVLQLMLMATSLQRQISMSITNPIVKALQLQKLFKFLEISTFGRVAIFLPCFLVLQE